MDQLSDSEVVCTIAAPRFKAWGRLEHTRTGVHYWAVDALPALLALFAKGCRDQAQPQTCQTYMLAMLQYAVDSSSMTGDSAVLCMKWQPWW